MFGPGRRVMVLPILQIKKWGWDDDLLEGQYLDSEPGLWMLSPAVCSGLSCILSFPILAQWSQRCEAGEYTLSEEDRDWT